MDAKQIATLLCVAITVTVGQASTAQVANIGNLVWMDSNRNGVQDSGEVGIQDVTVQLWNGTRTELLASTVTSGSGTYVLQGATNTALRVRALLPNASLRYSPMDAGGSDVLDSDVFASGDEAGFTAAFTLASNVISITSIDIGMMLPQQANLGNLVWEDLDRDGIQDAGESGILGATLQLWNSGMSQLFASTTSNSVGVYTLLTPEPGDYRVRIIPPTGYALAPKDQGGSDLLDSDFNMFSPAGFTDTYVIASNVISVTHIDAGLISNRVFANGFE
ncbi:MAG: Serine-aspartate repeat-containing protein D precursor [Alphaproteobacteria bacterium ADurb.BinA280]|jgi:hypothetical protein|nr:MAG: Serine-aspartate repeat-containing protein D precursor [Alphaproteobacteria bacterium ADurb.BinA280]